MHAKRITALALALVMTLLLAACGSKTVVNDDGTKTEQTEHGVKVTQTAAKAVQTEKYETADFSMTIPKGWTVTTGGTNIYHSIRVSDPNEPLNQMFVLLKADVLLHSQAGNDAWQQNYNMQRASQNAENQQSNGMGPADEFLPRSCNRNCLSPSNLYIAKTSGLAGGFDFFNYRNKCRKVFSFQLSSR